MQQDAPPAHWTLVSQGAEARVYKTAFFGSDRSAIVKQRFRKLYRHPTLDEQLTTRRIKEEARNLHRCLRAAIRVPVVYAVDVAQQAIYMEFVEGPSVKAYLQRHYTGQQAYSCDLMPLAAKIGASVAQVHDLSLIHGDLTTSNMLISGVDQDIVMIDFGLSYQSTMTEDKAVDLYVLERALSSTHPATDHLWREILRVYRSTSQYGEAVIKKLDEVRRRGRKRTMIG